MSTIILLIIILAASAVFWALLLWFLGGLGGGNANTSAATASNTKPAAKVSSSTKPAIQPKPAAGTKPAAKSSANSKAEETLARIQAKADDMDFSRIGTATAADKDDLKQIKGIGPFIEEKLNALGIFTFQQIANLNAKDRDMVNEAIEFFPGRAKRDDWVGQAKKLAK